MSDYYRRWLEYKRRYDREHYKKTAIRRDIYDELMRVCSELHGSKLGLNECLSELVRGWVKVKLGDLCGILEVAVRLANKHPEEPESRVLFEKYEEYCLR